MKKTAVLLFLALFSVVAGCKVLAKPRPEIIVDSSMGVHDKTFVWWDCPVFVSYSDGKVIWRKRWEQSLNAFSTTDAPHASIITEKIRAIVTQFEGKTFIVTGSTNPERTVIWSDGKKITVWGNWDNPRSYEPVPADGLHERLNENERMLLASLPSEIRSVLRELRAFSPTVAKPWRPERLSLVLQQPLRSYSGGIEWPADWPHSFSPAAIFESGLQIELPGSILQDLSRLAPFDGPAKVFRLRGEARYANLRFLFPDEDGPEFRSSRMIESNSQP